MDGEVTPDTTRKSHWTDFANLYNGGQGHVGLHRLRTTPL